MNVSWSKPDFTEEEISAGIDSLRNYIGANGPNVELFEKELAQVVGSKYAIGVNNGTSALLVTLMCMREKYKKKEKFCVGVPSFTFIASANSSKEIFGDVKLLDCDLNSWNITSDNIKEEIDLLMSVDVGGLSCDYDNLKRSNIPIIADSAESLGSEYKGKLVGTQVPFHCFSLHRAKIVSCGEGGIITTNDEELYDLARSFTNHGYSKVKKEHEYIHSNFGLNFRMNDIQAAIARVQLKKLPKYVQHRNKIAQIYKTELANLFKFQEFDEQVCRNNYFFFGVLTDKRDELLRLLLENKIEVKTWTAVHKQTIWNTDNNLFNASEISDKIILLPIHNTITENEVAYVIDTLKDYFQ